MHHFTISSFMVDFDSKFIQMMIGFHVFFLLCECKYIFIVFKCFIEIVEKLLFLSDLIKARLKRSHYEGVAMKFI